jgi:hypothetical protein
MKSIIKIILVSALGGFISLGTYKMFFEQAEVRTYIETPASNQVKQINYNRASPAVDFVMAAEKSINSVVHVCN